MEDVSTLRLSDSFADRSRENCALECVAALLNINYGHNDPVMKSCRKLYEYAYLVAEIRKNLPGGMPAPGPAQPARFKKYPVLLLIGPQHPKFSKES